MIPNDDHSPSMKLHMAALKVLDMAKECSNLPPEGGDIRVEAFNVYNRCIVEVLEGALGPEPTEAHYETED